jgi:hypothetical protein
MDGGTEILRTAENKSLIENGSGKPAVFAFRKSGAGKDSLSVPQFRNKGGML